ncbi:MAG: peptidase M20, partial [Terriglobia bacterium]
MSSPVEAYIESHRDRFLNELKSFLAIPSVSTLPQHKPDVERANEFVADRLRAAGIEHVERIPTGGHPLVYGEWLK